MKDLHKTSLELTMESVLVNCKGSSSGSSSSSSESDECICAARGLSRSDEHEAFS